MIHRDVKPDNILLERDTGRAIVMDFGIARVDGGTSSSSPGAIVGTPRYMSPEQSRGDTVDGRSDLYSLGAVAYFALTGRPPIDGDSSVAILARKAMVTATPLAAVRTGLPPRFAASIDRCLARAPGERWPSVEEFAAAIRATSARQQVPAPIRTFVREADQVGSEVATAVTAAAISGVLMALVAAIASSRHDFSSGLALAFVLVMYMAVGASTLGLAGIRLAQLASRARALLAAGYGHSAVRPALLADAREHDVDERPPRSARRMLAEGLLGVAGTVGSLMLANAQGTAFPLLGLAGSVAIPTLVIRRALDSRRAQDGWWSRLLRGPFGRALFGVAGIRLGKRASLPVAGEPTSVALRSELTALFAALPDGQRDAFADLPALALRLERQVELLRDRTPNPETDRRLQSAVAALELLRLDLLRLSAAEADAGDLTRDLDEARRVSDGIEARLRANAEVGRLLSADS